MVELEVSRLNAVFHALGDATRRSMLLSLATGDRAVSELAAPYQMSLAAASKHIKVLEDAGLIRRQIRWRTHICSLEPTPLASAFDWLRFYEVFWSDRLDALDQLLRDESSRAEPGLKQPKPPQVRKRKGTKK